MDLNVDLRLDTADAAIHRVKLCPDLLLVKILHLWQIMFIYVGIMMECIIAEKYAGKRHLQAFLVVGHVTFYCEPS